MRYLYILSKKLSGTFTQNIFEIDILEASVSCGFLLKVLGSVAIADGFMSLKL